MAASPTSDRDLIDALGVSALVAEGYTEWQVKKWRSSKRGIPWKERGRVAKIARKLRRPLPPNFDEQRTAA